MGKTLLILFAGFAASFGVLAMSKSQRLASSIDRMLNQVSDYSAKNAANSGAHKALNQLYLDPAWRGIYNNLNIAGGTANITVVNDSANGAPKAHYVKILSSSANALSQVIVFDSEFHEFAVWAKDSVNLVSTATQDSNGVNNSDLLRQKAPFMPKIDEGKFYNMAAGQDHLCSEDVESHFHPDPGYPGTGSFYVDTLAVPKVANVVYINGNLHIQDGRTVYGIYLVEGDVFFDTNVKLEGVIYLPNATSEIYGHSSMAALDNSQVVGGIVTWGKIDLGIARLNVRHRPAYLRELVSISDTYNPPIRVLTWK